MRGVSIMALVPLGIVGWFPQEFAPQFYMLKGLLAVAATVLLLVHMTRRWPVLLSEHRLGKRMRYLTLLAYAVLVTGASVEQVHDGSLVSYRNLGSAIVSILLLVTIIISMREERQR